MVKEKKLKMGEIIYYGKDTSIYESLNSIAKVKDSFKIIRNEVLKNKDFRNHIFILDDSYFDFFKFINLISSINKKNLIITANKESVSLQTFQDLSIFLKPIKVFDLYKEILKKFKKQEFDYTINLNVANLSLIDPNGINLKLTEKEFRLIEVLLNNHEKPLSKENILSSVWGLKEEKTTSMNTRVLETLVSKIRRKINSVNIKVAIKKSKNGYLLIQNT